MNRGRYLCVGGALSGEGLGVGAALARVILHRDGSLYFATVFATCIAAVLINFVIVYVVICRVSSVSRLSCVP